MLWLCPASAENTPGLLPPYFGLEMAEQIWTSLHTHHKTCGFICIYIPVYILFAGQVRAATDLDTNHRKSTLDGDSWNINLGKIKAFNSFFHHEFVQCCFCSCVCVCVFCLFFTIKSIMFPWFSDPHFQIAVFSSIEEKCYHSFGFWKTLPSLLSHISASNCAYTYIYFCLYPWQMRKQFWREYTCSHADSLFAWIKFLLQTSAHQSIQLLIHPHKQKNP